jgi:PEP-CTERM motif
MADDAAEKPSMSAEVGEAGGRKAQMTRPVARVASGFGAIVAGTLALAVGATGAHALVIQATFDSSITGSANATAIEGSINAAISTLDGLYTNSITVPVTFTYDPASPGNLLGTTQYTYLTSYSTYVTALQAEATANPQNTVLATALAHLSSGNGAGGGSTMVLSFAQAHMLGLTSLIPPAPATININSTQPFSFTRPVPGGSDDLIGGLEHELDEVLGGGGMGSTLNQCAGGSVAACSQFGALDLYRYSAAHTPSHTTSGSATSYLSIDGGVTSIVAFNQNSGGDYADFAPSCGGGSPSGPGQLIQNAFNCTGQDEPYTTASPEATMLQSIGWNTSSGGSAPMSEPGSIALLGSGLVGLVALRRRRGAVAA